MAEVFQNSIDLKRIKKQFPIWKRQYGKFLPKNKQTKILDVGCGFGSMVYFLQSLGFNFAEGIDINRHKIDVAINSGIKNLHHGDAMSFFRDKDNFYDTIFLMDVLLDLSLEEARELLYSINRALKPNGILIIKSANAESPMVGNLQYGHFGKQLHITENNLKNILRNIGFDQVGVYPMRPAVHGIPSFIRFCFWFLIEGFLKFYRLVETGTKKGVFTQSIIAVAKK